MLDVGTGSGFLALYAAKKGAKKVFAVEANKQMAQLAKDLVERNNLQDKVTVINKPVEQVDLGCDLGGEKVDVLVSEWMGFY